MEDSYQTLGARPLTLRVLAVIIVCGLLIATPFIVRALQSSSIVYRPLDACQLLTKEVAEELLGKTVINRRSAPEINTDTRVATSKCSYSDTSLDSMAVVALAVQSGVDDQGVMKLKNDFSRHQEANQTQPVDALDQEAFFNPVNGQLQLRDDHHWYILNHSHGGQVDSATLEDLVRLAEQILPSQKT